MRPHFTATVGVAPGTTTLQLAGTSVRVWDPYARGIVDLRNPLGAIDTRARIRWDIIGVVGGGALVISMMTALVASAIGRR